MDNDDLSQAELDRLSSRLSDPAVWAEPPPELQEQIVAAIADAGGNRRSRVVRYALLGAAAAVVLAVGVTFGLKAGGDDKTIEYAASLEGTELAPDASGHVTMTKTLSGWKIELHATGLPRRDKGEYYEAWVKNAAGALVPVGTFNQFDDVTLWAGVPPTDFPTFTVTRQLADGDPASTGQVVLVGTAELAP